MDVPLEFLNAKLKGRRTRVYEGDRLRELAQCTSLTELCGRLYPREPAMERLALERRLRRDCVSELASFTRYLDPSLGVFYLALLRRFQVENIVVLLRLFAGGGERPSPEQYLTELPPAFAVSAGNLMASQNVAEFLQKLPTDLAGAGSEVLYLDELRRTTAFVEMAFWRAYWDGVVRAADVLGAEEQTACAGPVVCEIASARMLAVLRAARSYKLGWEELEPLLPRWSAPGMASGVRVSEAGLGQLFSDPSPARVAKTVRGVSPQEAESLVDLEAALWRKTWRGANRLFYSEMDGPGVVVAYFYVRLNELRNLTSLVEAIHYGGQAHSGQPSSFV